MPSAAPVGTAVAKPAGITPRKQLLILGGFITFLVGSIAVVLIVLLGGRGPEKGEQKSDGTTPGTQTADSGKPSNPSNPSNPDKTGKPDVPPDNKPPAEDKRPQIVKPHIDKGVAYLVKRVQEKRDEEKKNGNIIFWGVDWERGEGLTQGPAGVVALVGLTLLECDVAGDDPDVAWLAETLEKQAGNLKQTHPTAAAVLFLARLNEIKPLEGRQRQVLQSLTLRLINAQLDYGAWSPDVQILNPGQENELLKNLKEGNFAPTKKGSGTASNTNFAIQALWAARKLGIPMQAPLVAAAGHFQRTQLGNGSWAFSEAVKDRFFATSTCAGLIALAMEKAILDKGDRPFVPGEKSADPVRAFAFLGRSIGEAGEKATHEDKETVAGSLFMADSWGDIYFLWAVERVATIYGRETIEGKDWYEWGYKVLLAAQNKEDGSWSDRHGLLADTCFAVLFLKKSNFSKDLTEKLKTLK